VGCVGLGPMVVGEVRAAVRVAVRAELRAKIGGDSAMEVMAFGGAVLLRFRIFDPR
jgi:hypothetical protein